MRLEVGKENYSDIPFEGEKNGTCFPGWRRQAIHPLA
jgi:hypothetical protein